MTGSVKRVLLCIKGVYTLIMTRLGLQIPAIDENKVEECTKIRELGERDYTFILPMPR